jgi:hypothetical protein
MLRVCAVVSERPKSGDPHLSRLRTVAAPKNGDIRHENFPRFALERLDFHPQYLLLWATLGEKTATSRPRSRGKRPGEDISATVDVLHFVKR